MPFTFRPTNPDLYVEIFWILLGKFRHTKIQRIKAKLSEDNRKFKAEFLMGHNLTKQLSRS